MVSQPFSELGGVGRPVELDAPQSVQRCPVVVVGAGPVGLTAAIDLAQAKRQGVLFRAEALTLMRVVQ